MIRISQVQVRTLSIDRVLVHWEIDPTTEDVWDYKFRVERRDGPGAESLTLADGIVDRYLLVDYQLNLKKYWDQVSYRVGVYKRTEPDGVVYTPWTQIGARPDLIALEMRFRELLYFKEYAGIQLLVLSQRQAGTRCGCVDPVLEKRLVDVCLTCYGTGFVGGYHHPVLTWGQIITSPTEIRFGQATVDSPESASLLLPYWPLVNTGDLIVEVDRPVRWRVIRADRTERFRSTVHQQAILRKLSPSDVEYKIPIDMENVFDLYQHEPRNDRMVLV